MPNIILLKNYGIVKISGTTARTFLQGQLTNDMQEVTPATFRLTAYCNPQGRMWFIARIWQQQDDFFIHLPTEVISPSITDLQRYAMFSKVAVEMQSDMSSLALLGAEMPALLQSEIKLPVEPYTTISTGELMALCVDAERWLLVGPTSQLQTFAENFASHITTETSLWDLSEIRAGIPTVWEATQTQLLPHDVNLPELHAVNFNKGCYKGQEIIARMQYRGQRKKHLYQVYCPIDELVEPPTPGTPITDDAKKHVGAVVSAAPAPQSHFELLAVLPAALMEQNVPLFINKQRISYANFSKQ